METEQLVKNTRNRSEAELQQKESEISSLAASLNQLSMRLRVSAAALFAVVGLGAIFSTGKFITWDWLQNHPNRLGLYGCAIVSVAILTWTILDTDKTRRKYALLTLGGAIRAVFTSDCWQMISRCV